MNRRNKLVLYYITVVLIGVGIALPVCYGVSTFEVQRTIETPQPTMTVEGQFDRVELLDAHYGNYNGMFVIDEQLAVAYENGTVPIANTHYEGSYRELQTNFLFQLKVYHGISRLNETIDVMGGDTETYEYPNLIVTVSLKISVVNLTDKGNLTLGIAVGVGMFGVFMIIGVSAQNEIVAPEKKRYTSW